MKRTIIVAWCILFSLGMYAQKALIIHKKDGTKIEFPVKAISDLRFTDKAIIEDNDYTRIAHHIVYTPATPNKTIDVAFYILCQSGVEFWDAGICYSTTSGDISNRIPYKGMYIKHNGNITSEGKIYGTDTLFYGEITELEFETTYYCHSYVNYQGTYYYSEEYSINTGKPRMSWYGATVDPELYAETGFVMPSEEAWNALISTSPHINHRPAFLLDEWNRYATPERVRELKSQCDTTIECSDGTLYLLDAVEEGFVTHVMELCGKGITILGCESESSNSNTPDTIMCDASWGVPDNKYWEYKATSIPENTSLTYTTSVPLLANYKYKIEVIMAPETVDEEKLPNKYRLQFKNKENFTLGNDLAENATECAVHTYEVTTAKFVESSVLIKGRVGSRETGFDRNIRVAQIRITPIEPIAE
ncbi:MAG: hypothetical protein II269_00335 [Bacteroidaceae bacterium]|nr:hypothetical protein [Bacteroidaceae bacterium]